MFCIKEYLNRKFADVIKELKNIVEKNDWVKLDDDLKEVIGQHEDFCEAINDFNDAAFYAQLSVASFPLCSVCPKVNTPSTINKSNDLRMYNILLQMSPDFSKEEAQAYRLLVEAAYLDIYGTKIQHDKLHKELLNCLENEQLDKLIKQMSIEMLTHYYLVVSIGSIQYAIDVVVSNYLTKCTFNRLSFARSEHFISERCVLNIGYSLDEGNADYFALEDTKKIIKLLSFTSNEDYEKFVHIANTTRYCFEKKMVRWLIERFGIDKFEKAQRSSINVLSLQFIEDPCLIYKLLRLSDLGKWQEVHKIINTIKVDENGKN